MVNSVTFPSSLGGDNSTVDDSNSPTTGLGNNGHRTRFIPALSQTVIMAQTAVTGASNAAASASTAQQAATDAAQTLQDTQATVASVGSMLGINFGSFSVVDGEMIVSHLTTTTPSLVDGDLILTYEGL